MSTVKPTGRIVGVLLLLQMLIGFSVNFALVGPVFEAPGFLLNAALHPSRMAMAALLGMAGGLLSIAIAIQAFPVFRQRSQALALWFVTLAAAGLALNVVESTCVMSMLSLSEAYVKASGAARDVFPLLRLVVSGARNWTHYLGLSISGCILLAFYLALLRLALVPRALAGSGIVAVLLQMTAVAMPLFGYEIVFPMLAPLGLVQLTVAIWIMARGWPVGRFVVTNDNLITS